MKKQYKHHRSHKRIVFVVIAIVTLALAGFVAYYLLHNSSKSNSSVNLSPATTQQQAAGNQVKSTNAGSSSSDATKNTSSSSTTTNTPSTTVQLSANGQNGSTYQLRYIINSVVSNATCNLTLTLGSQTITETSSVQALAQSSTCEGFDIPMNKLSSGSWTAVMVVSGDNVNASVTDTVQVE
jgi:hypothetical protein